MNEDYWARFEMTGKVEDYLTYQGITAHKAEKDRDQNESRKDEESEPDDYRDRNDSVSASDWRIR